VLQNEWHAALEACRTLCDYAVIKWAETAPSKNTIMVLHKLYRDLQLLSQAGCDKHALAFQRPLYAILYAACSKLA
jgi:hypothetical protein